MKQLTSSPTEPVGMIEACRRSLAALTRCRESHGLTSASLTVLRALISFLPRNPGSQLQTHVVWPSNASLAERADGMDERTLRRHLARLCDAGLIRRQASPNGKRFALRLRSAVVAAFGFDLSPLLHRQAEIEAEAEQLDHRAEEIRVLRSMIRSLVHRLEPDMPADDLAEIRRLLRRNVAPEILSQTCEALRQALATEDLTGSNSQIDRHQQSETKESSVLTGNDQSQGPDLAECLEATADAVMLSPEPIRNWADLERLGTILAPMVGIGLDVLTQARRSMGRIAAAVSVLCIVQKGSEIAKPAAYLRRLAQLAESGGYSLTTMIRGAGRFAAANPA